MEQEWSSVVKTGQKVKVKMKGKFVGVVIGKPLFLAKLAFNGAYYYVTAKAIMRPSGISPSEEIQFTDLHL